MSDHLRHGDEPMQHGLNLARGLNEAKHPVVDIEEGRRLLTKALPVPWPSSFYYCLKRNTAFIHWAVNNVRALMDEVERLRGLHQRNRGG